MFLDKRERLSLAVGLYLTHKKRNERKKWRRPWLRAEVGCVGSSLGILRELQDSDSACYNNYLRMGMIKFNALLEMVRPLIEKETNLRDTITAEQRLAITLRYLAIGIYSVYNYYLSSTYLKFCYL